MNFLKNLNKLLNSEVYRYKKKYNAKIAERHFVVLAVFILILGFTLGYFIENNNSKPSYFFIGLVSLVIFVYLLASTSWGKKIINIISPIIKRNFIPNYPKKDYESQDENKKP